MNKGTATHKKDNKQSNLRNKSNGDKASQAPSNISKKSPKTVDNSKKRNNKKHKNTKRKKIWIIIAIVAGVLAASGVGIVLAYNNGLIGSDNEEDCTCGVSVDDVKPCEYCAPGVYYKPIIYLYPEEKTDISVKLGYPELITTDYPSYDDEWNVTAYPNGNLEIDNRNYYALYYESQNKISFEKTDTGFIVESDKVAEFLEEKLAILGLDERESEEFIVYWLPKLQAKKYAYIRFATEDEITKNMPLEVNPKPDTTIRVLMAYQGLDEPESVIEQKLTQARREGYTLVEWGGTEIK